MDEEKEKTQVDEKETGSRETNAIENSEDRISGKEDILDEAKRVNEEMRKLNEERLKILEREEKLEASRIASGRGRIGAPQENPMSKEERKSRERIKQIGLATNSEWAKKMEEDDKQRNYIQ